MPTIEELLDDATIQRLKQKQPREPKDGELTHVWKGKRVTEAQFAHYARMAKDVPANCGPISAITQVLKCAEDEP